ncbi:MAG: 50S ribosomal protein L29 [Candidatus Doudnabacteria bacterium CG10_big_fil_rev_8_21_14_0_10_41_10]|uniref:Large ribosomal subunit protein uL29 n=1 Tax=Candidatus Doudnabacteria bacterium CG10_big_fil_rev_8_21_14_0_10_41_10 TaxID=1974551 RepID=A0A2H0VDD4_9BACT|nr:MAG: 50S ribosomal protein L29 [Candidatus Doudnabacteria bacterium CG10_big_fil_rev_8_21_14_0_10_41_10]
MSNFLKTKELRTKKPDQLQKMLAERRERFRALRFDISSKQVKNHRQLRFLKREIARIMTILAESK